MPLIGDVEYNIPDTVDTPPPRKRRLVVGLFVGGVLVVLALAGFYLYTTMFTTATTPAVTAATSTASTTAATSTPQHILTAAERQAIMAKLMGSGSSTAVSSDTRATVMNSLMARPSSTLTEAERQAIRDKFFQQQMPTQ